ncbi:MAG: hypothetical protein A2915_01275 [Candidatus Yanofskybacteria bacterium RIFCSPLOWO2_01_FULL_41_34]|nr:MAG: hypothetical protein A2915_01275 [Candidatus Yanofskybacteria bacterium RIFCSPLOWO2_01_FULL_41_34]
MILLQGRATKNLAKIHPPSEEVKEKTEFFVSPSQYRITIFSSPACRQAGRFSNPVFSLVSKMIKLLNHLTIIRS